MMPKEAAAFSTTGKSSARNVNNPANIDPETISATEVCRAIRRLRFRLSRLF